MTVTREPGQQAPPEPVTTGPAAPRTTVVAKPPPAPIVTAAPEAGGGGSGGAGGKAEPSRAAALAAAIAPIASGALAIVAALLLGLSANLVLLSGIEESTTQTAAFNALRVQLARGTAPVTQTGAHKKLLAMGTPVAILDIPEIGVVNAVVRNGTTGSVLTGGPGHQRDTVLPGQAGVSVIMGRAWSYGGPFGHLGQLHPGDKITAITGQGVSRYTVTDMRVAGDPDQPLPAGEGRLTLETALGSSFIPSGVLRVDALLTSAVRPTPALLNTGALPGPEQPLGSDPAALLPLLLWLVGLAAVAAGAVVAWARWGRWQTWLVFGPLALMTGLFTADQVTLLLPNLM